MSRRAATSRSAAQDALVAQVERKLIGIKGVEAMDARVGRTNSLGGGGGTAATTPSAASSCTS